MARVQDLFALQHGTSLSLSALSIVSTYEAGCANFISRTSKNNGVSAVVKLINDVGPFNIGLITVALSGNSVLEAFIQDRIFYTGYHVMVLEPKLPMTFQEKFYYCQCIKRNRYRYNYGRQANRTLKDINLPDSVPDWVYKLNVNRYLDVLSEVF